jgi:N-acetyl-1-D-myo-inositol-2-amino-2-deoxy-alpha-D-glucopyranoside deacetylase
MRAAELARPEWEISKIYWNTMPRSVLQRGIDKMREMGSDFFGVESAEDLPFAQDDSLVTTLVEAAAFAPQKIEAMKAHPTQMTLDGPFFALSNNLGIEVMGDEYYTLVYGEKSGPFDAEGRETDLFNGIK